MISQHRRAYFYALIILALAWGIAVDGRALSGWTNRTADKLIIYVGSVDFTKLSADERIRAIDKFARDFKSLPLDERRRCRFEHPWNDWLDVMTPNEKNRFTDALAPEDFNRLVSSFSQLPEERRQLLVSNSVKRLSDVRGRLNLGGFSAASAGEAWEMPKVLQEKLVADGLQEHYQSDSPEGKINFALFLEELQQMMGSRDALRGRPYRPQGSAD